MLSIRNGKLNKKISSPEEKRLENSKHKIFQRIDDEKRAALIMARMKKQLFNESN